MIRYDKYKDSGVDWLGEIPEHWEDRRIKDIFKKIGSGTTPNTSRDDYYENGTIYWLNTTDLNNDLVFDTKQKITQIALKESGLKIYPINSLAIAMYGQGKTRGTVGLLQIPTTTNQAACIMFSPKGVNTKYILYWFIHKYDAIRSINIGATQPNMNQDFVKFLALQCPPLSEQSAIATYLDSKTTAIDRKVDLLEQKITRYQQLRKSLINETVCRGLNKNVKLKDSGIEWIGEIPEHWEVKRIKDLTEVKRGASPRPIDDPIFFDDNGEFAWVRISDLTASERYLEFTKEKLSTLGASLSVKRYPKDFILSIAGTVGKPIITKIKCCIHDGFVWFPNLKIDCEYLFYIFTTGLPYQGLGKLGTQLNLNTETVGLISIPLPSNSEIIEIVSYLDDKVQKIESIITNLIAQIETLKELRKTLINDVVTGKIKVSG